VAALTGKSSAVAAARSSSSSAAPEASGSAAEAALLRSQLNEASKAKAGLSQELSEAQKEVALLKEELEALGFDNKRLQGALFAANTSASNNKKDSEELRAVQAALASSSGEQKRLELLLRTADAEVKALKSKVFTLADDLDNQNRCKACMDEKKCILTLPCKHLSLCKTCFGKMEAVIKADNAARVGSSGYTPSFVTCLLCRGDVKSFIEVAGGF
jgi:chromosome segregation ATPase